MDLVGKIAVITGGTKGIGLAVAKDLIQNGASRVIISGRDIWEGGKALKILTDMIDNKDGNQKAIYVPTDVTSEEELRELFDYTATNMGGLDILVNSAAILNESSMWRRMVDTNVVKFYLIKIFV
uniref:15-hydroxyprostaglandin dehydrogenase [NAD(+)] n=2 Tax=Schizaphis graminum TaxID=13262 RepID=A0A2S2NUM3_SCHGA